jgi:hypothetical protein
MYGCRRLFSRRSVSDRFNQQEIASIQHVFTIQRDANRGGSRQAKGAIQRLTVALREYCKLLSGDLALALIIVGKAKAKQKGVAWPAIVAHYSGAAIAAGATEACAPSTSSAWSPAVAATGAFAGDVSAEAAAPAGTAAVANSATAGAPAVAAAAAAADTLSGGATGGAGALVEGVGASAAAAAAADTGGATGDSGGGASGPGGPPEGPGARQQQRPT